MSSEVNDGGAGWFTIVTCWLPLRVAPPIVWLAETVTTVSLPISPAVSSPEADSVVALELSDQLGDADSEEPSLKWPLQ
jgi:hypothetical protein